MSQRLLDEFWAFCCALLPRFGEPIGSVGACRILSSRTAAPVVSRKGLCCDAALAPDCRVDDSCGGAVCACCGGVAGSAAIGPVVCGDACCCAGGDCGGADSWVACAGGPGCCAGAGIVVAADCCWDVLEPGAGGLVVGTALGDAFCACELLSAGRCASSFFG